MSPVIRPPKSIYDGFHDPDKESLAPCPPERPASRRLYQTINDEMGFRTPCFVSTRARTNQTEHENAAPPPGPSTPSLVQTGGAWWCVLGIGLLGAVPSASQTHHSQDLRPRVTCPPHTIHGVGHACGPLPCPVQPMLQRPRDQGNTCSTAGRTLVRRTSILHRAPFAAPLAKEHDRSISSQPPYRYGSGRWYYAPRDMSATMAWICAPAWSTTRILPRPVRHARTASTTRLPTATHGVPSSPSVCADVGPPPMHALPAMLAMTRTEDANPPPMRLVRDSAHSGIYPPSAPVCIRSPPRRHVPSSSHPSVQAMRGGAKHGIRTSSAQAPIGQWVRHASSAAHHRVAVPICAALVCRA
ncbi:hypothetical protein B0H10DRAFT_2428916 [Mycena sp. CBHHK59/15]|nr:hypothetical protein B0H10DRAFT_2428916 [Mycena sp. CBHHK59/15]